jgi:hypothetical protein
MRLRIQRQFFALEFFHPAPTETTVGRFSPTAVAFPDVMLLQPPDEVVEAFSRVFPWIQ